MDLPVVTVPGLGRSPNALGDVTALRALVAEMRRFRPHIVHTHTAKAGLLGRLAARTAGVPLTVHTFHGHLLHGYFPPPATRAIVELERRLATTTTRLVAVGANVRDELLAAGIGRRSQYVVIPPGVSLPPAPAPELAREVLGLPGRGLVVGFVARLTAVKRPDRFVDMALQIHRSRPDVTFFVAGDGQLLADMRARAAPLGDRIHFLGWRSDVETLYAASDLVVLTSDNEGMPVSLIEAAVAGTPAVTTDVGSAREVVLDGVTGFVTSTKVPDLTAAVARVLDDDDLRRDMSVAASEHGTRHFATERLVGDTATLYQQLTGVMAAT